MTDDAQPWTPQTGLAWDYVMTWVGPVHRDNVIREQFTRRGLRRRKVAYYPERKRPDEPAWFIGHSMPGPDVTRDGDGWQQP